MEDENKAYFEEQINNVFTCDICAEKIQDDEDETLKCGHIVHALCFRKYIEHETKSSKKLNIPCLKCQLEKKENPFINDSDIARLTPWLGQERLTISVSTVILNNPDKYKQCTTPDCKGVAEVLDGN